MTATERIPPDPQYAFLKEMLTEVRGAVQEIKDSADRSAAATREQLHAIEKSVHSIERTNDATLARVAVVEGTVGRTDDKVVRLESAVAALTDAQRSSQEDLRTLTREIYGDDDKKQKGVLQRTETLEVARAEESAYRRSIALVLTLVGTVMTGVAFPLALQALQRFFFGP